MVCSAMGMVTVAPRKDSEFIALGDWMRERSTFYSLRSLRFFKHFKRAKSFRFWHRNVRFKLYIQVRNRLKQVSLPRPRAALPQRARAGVERGGPCARCVEIKSPRAAPYAADAIPGQEVLRDGPAGDEPALRRDARAHQARRATEP